MGGRQDVSIYVGKFYAPMDNGNQCECNLNLVDVCYPICRLDVYIYDYFLKKNLQASAKAFQAEGDVSPEPVGMFLLALPLL